MDLLSRLEHALEDLFEGVFSRAFRTQLQPIEIAKRLTREVEAHRTVSVSATYVPNDFTVHLAPETYQSLQGISVRLLGELEQYLREYIGERNYQVVGPVAVHLREDAAMKTGEVAVSAVSHAHAAPNAAPVPSVLRSVPTERPRGTARVAQHAAAETERTALYIVQPTLLEIIAGESVGRTIALADNLTIGRGPANVLVFADPGISRQHAQIVLEDVGWVLRDTGSTNGTYVNGQRITEHALAIGETIEMGSVMLKVK